MGCVASKPAAAAPAAKQEPAAALEAAAVPPPPAGKPPVLQRRSPTSPLSWDEMYKPDAEQARLQSLLDCKLLDTADEARFDSITGLLKDVFQVPMALVSLIDDDKLVFKSVAGTDCRQGNRLHSFCDASLRAPNPTMMIVPDTLKDARFVGGQFVQGPPHVRCYAGAPLVSSEGFILGSLGIMDLKPRCFPAGALNIIANFAELVVREMERDKAQAALQQAKVDKALAARQHTVRALSCFAEAVALINTAEADWPLLYVNEQFCSATGVSEPACLSSRFWQLFSAAGGGGAQDAAQDAAARGAPLTVTVQGGDGGPLTVELKPATADHLSAAAPHIGIPNFIEGLEPADVEGVQGFYFGVVKGALGKAGPGGSAPPSSVGASASQAAGAPAPPASERSSRSGGGKSRGGGSRSSCSSHVHGLEPPEALAGIRLGPLLGRGSYGFVYRGTWHSAPAAVKVMECWVDPRDAAEASQPMLEALLSKRLTHPNIVQTFEHAVQLLGPPDDDSHTTIEGDMIDPLDAADAEAERRAAGRAEERQQVWLVQQYCNHGTLGDAIDRGWLRASCSLESGPNLLAVLATAQEIAAALQYLHQHNVLHGDLTANNVLLAGTQPDPQRDPRGFQAKVCDFGLSRVFDPRANGGQVQTQSCGTVSHMPLELIQNELLTQAADAFSFGVLCWEMVSGQRAWAGLTSFQVLFARTQGGRRLEVPDSCPPDLKALIEACLQDDHTQRPSFDEITATLGRMLQAEQAAAANGTQ